MNKIEKQYLKDLKSGIGKLTDTKRAFLSEIAADVHEFVDNHQDITMQNLYDEFGFPENVAQQFYCKDDYTLLKKKAKRYAVQRIFIVILCVIAISLSFELIKKGIDEKSIITVDNSFETTAVH